MNETLQKEADQSSDQPESFDPERKDWRQDEHPFTVAVSIATVGGLSRLDEGGSDKRKPYAGDMSEAYPQPDRTDLDKAKREGSLTPEQKKEMSNAARERVIDYIELTGYYPQGAAIMRPQTDFTKPLGTVDVDDADLDSWSGNATWLKEQGDFIYTRNPEVVLGCRPADCPVLVIKGADTTGNEMLAMLHVGWQGLNAGYLEDGIGFLSQNGIDLESLRIYVGPSANKESFPYTSDHDPRVFKEGSRFSHKDSHNDKDKLFVDVRKNEETGKYEFSMDMPGFINYMLTSPDRIGLKPEQVAFDGSDVARLDSGYSSNSRVRRTGEVNTRDIIIASMSDPKSPEYVAA